NRRGLKKAHSMPSFLLGQLAELLECRLAGDPQVNITGVATIENAAPSEITFLANPKYAPKARFSRAAAIIAAEPVSGTSASTLISANPYLDFARALALFYQPPKPPGGIHPAASIAPTASLGANPSIGAFAVIGEHATIGANAVLYPHAVIYQGC